MSDVNLLMFGCAISFIAVAGAYVYLRERFLVREQQRESVPIRTREERRLRDVA